jgi:hypothetical protein
MAHAPWLDHLVEAAAGGTPVTGSSRSSLPSPDPAWVLATDVIYGAWHLEALERHLAGEDNEQEGTPRAIAPEP